MILSHSQQFTQAERSSARRKAVWGPKRSLTSCSLILFTLVLFGLGEDNALAAGRSRGAVTRLRPGTVSAQVQNYKFDDEVTRRINRRRIGETANVIVTLQAGAELPLRFQRYVEPDGKLDIINGYALANVPVNSLNSLGDDASVHRVHFNRPAKKHDALSSAAVQANAFDADHGVDQQRYPYTGQGVTVAVIDSGLTNDVLADLADARVRKFVDFVQPGNRLRTDGNGHGTHVTGIVGGTGQLSNRKYAGIAPGASIVSLRVLDDSGQGSIAAVIKGMNWVYKFGRRENVRVVNMSVGAAPTESYFTDPLTLAAKALVDRGVTVVAAAGNFGQNAAGELQWGGITSPGIAPWVLTVCAFSTQGTYDPSDDAIAGFSSSGPTAFDFAAKPDLCAPGVGIVSTAAPGSQLYQLGLSQDPSWVVGPDNRYESLSGTSMATPMVSGAIALMLQANPNLTPNLIKAILEYTATVQPGVSALRQGAGFMNVAGAVSLAEFYAQPVEGQSLPLDASWGRQIVWGNHLLSNGVISPGANAWKLGVPWGAAKTNFLDGDNIVWGTFCPDFCDNIVWGTFLDSDDNIVWGTLAAGRYVVWGAFGLGDDNIVWGTLNFGGDDNIVWGTHFFGDDNIVWGTFGFGDDNIVWGTDCGGADCDNVVWGAFSFDDNIVWGTGLFDDNIVWGTIGLFDDNIVWGTLIGLDDNIVWGTFDFDLDNIVWGTFFGDDNIVWGTANGTNVVWPIYRGGR